jgi:membrane fusion protein (multidrug efflux system)
MQSLRRAAWSLAIASFSFTFTGCERPRASTPPPPPTVRVAAASLRNVPLFVDAVGTLDGYVNVDVRARVKGFLARQHQQDGAAVKEGELLFTVDPAEYQAALDSARASLSRAVAAQGHARVAAGRRKVLAEQGAVSQQDFDDADAQHQVADAEVEVARAAVRQAELNLSYTQIRSPVSGVCGLAQVRPGNLVGQDGATLLATVSQLDPLRVTFPLSELDYVRSPDRLKGLGGRDLAWARKQFERLDRGEAAADDDPGVALVLSDGSVYPHRGVVVAANRQVDPVTGTIQLQALFPNPGGALRPGQYGRVRVPRPEEGRNAVAVPEKAFIEVQGTYSVAVVGEGNKVQLRRVQVGPSADGVRIVRAGVKAGERVVVEGVQKATDGAVVDAQPAQPAPVTGLR